MRTLIAVLVTALVVAGAMWWSRPEQPAAEPQADDATLQAVLLELRLNPPRTEEDVWSCVEQLTAYGDVTRDVVRSVLDHYVRHEGEDDREALRLLGYRTFEMDGSVYEIFDDYPYIRTVMQANKKRWYGPDEEADYQLALKARRETQAHIGRLQTDHKFRAVDGIRANLSLDPVLSTFHYTTRWADPYLICYASKERVSEYDLHLLSPQERSNLEARLAEKRRRWQPILDEKEAIFTQLHAEYRRRFGKALGLKDLTAPWGGRPDVSTTYRTFENGRPLVVWIFEDKEAWRAYRNVVQPDDGRANDYLDYKTGTVFLYDEPDDAASRRWEIEKSLRIGAFQLEYWFQRQRAKWRHPKFSQDPFVYGLAGLLGAVKMDSDRTLEFVELNMQNVKDMQKLAALLEDQFEKALPIVPLEKLVQFTTLGQFDQYVGRTYQLPPGIARKIFHVQAWAAVYFWMTFEDGKYAERFAAFHEQYQLRPEGPASAARAFRKAFGIRPLDNNAEVWESMEAEYASFVRGLLTMDLEAYEYAPPPRNG